MSLSEALKKFTGGTVVASLVALLATRPFASQTAMTDHRVFLGVGSNVQRETHIDIALNMLGEHLHDMRCSPVYESESLDGEHPPFFNLVVSATTRLSARELIAWIKEIEELHGRRRGQQMLIALDIDLLLFDDFAGLVDGVRVPRGEILTRAFVLYPLQLLAPQMLHPEFGLSMAELWRQLKPGPVLAPVRRQFGYEGHIPGKSLQEHHMTLV